MGAYIPAVTFSQVSAGAWTAPQRLTMSEDGWIAGFRLSATTAALSQVRVEIGHGWGNSAASAYLTQQIMIQDIPAAAGGWNVSSIGATTAIAEVQNFGGDGLDYNFAFQTGAPTIYSGTPAAIYNDGGLWARMRATAGGVGSAFDNYVLIVKER